MRGCLRNSKRRASSALSRCFSDASAALRDCYRADGHTCADGDPRVADALSTLGAQVRTACTDAQIVRTLGFGPFFTPAALSDRLGETCLGDAKSLAARSFGGPQGSLFESGSLDIEACIDTAYLEGARLISRSFGRQSRCVRSERFGGGCSASNTADWIQSSDLRTRARMEKRCQT